MEAEGLGANNLFDGRAPTWRAPQRDHIPVLMLIRYMAMSLWANCITYPRLVFICKTGVTTPTYQVVAGN